MEEPDDLPPPPAGMIRYVYEAGRFSDAARVCQEDAWVPSGISALLDAVDDEVAKECVDGMISPAVLTAQAGTHLRIYEASTGRTVEWLLIVPCRDELPGCSPDTGHDRPAHA